MNKGIKLGSHLEIFLSIRRIENGFTEEIDVFIKFLLVARNRVSVDFFGGKVGEPFYKGGSWHLNVKSTAEPNEIWSQESLPNEAEVTMSLLSESQDLCPLLFSVHLPLLPFMEWLSLLASMVVKNDILSPQPIPSRSQGDHWRLTKTLGPSSKL